MSNVFFISDTHFGHENAIKFRVQFSSIKEHDEYIVNRWNSTVGENDTVYHLGDFSFRTTQEYIDKVRSRLNGSIKLVTGNHDTIIPKDVEVLTGIYEYNKIWLSHAPIHPNELRGRVNIHGHVHASTIADKNYINVSCENINFTPINLKIIKHLITEKAYLIYGKVLSLNENLQTSN